MVKQMSSAEYRAKVAESVKNGESKYAELKKRTSSSDLTWADADPTLLRDAVAAVTADGAAVLLTVTSDGGALVVRVVDDTASTPFYAASTSALYDALTTLAEIARKA